MTPETPGHPDPSNRRTSTRSIFARVAFLVITAVAIFCIYRGTAAGIAVYHFARARELLGTGDWKRGFDSLRRAQRWDPGHEGSALLLARDLLARQRPQEARGLVAGLTHQGRHSVDVLDTLVRIAEVTGDDLGAQVHLEELTESHPAHIAGPIGLARRGDDGHLRNFLARHGDPPPRERSLPGTTDGSAEDVPPDRIRGLALLHLADDVGLRGYGTPSSSQSLLEARRLGASSISVRVPGRQSTIFDPEVVFGEEPSGGETDEAVIRTIRDAHLLGLDVLLKPHIMLGRITDDEWRGTLAYVGQPENESAWWQSYRAFILHYARIATREEVEIFCVGVELRAMVAACPERWSQLIRDVRSVYSGRLTYAANWYHEYEEIPFWGDLDLIGLQFFFPLSNAQNPTPEDLRAGVTRIIGNLNELAWGYDRPVILTEVGYKATPGAARTPWIWAEAGMRPDPEIQARAYEAIFDSFRDLPWFHGMYWWNWLSTPEPDDKFAPDFTPQGKPAEEVLRREWQAHAG